MNTFQNRGPLPEKTGGRCDSDQGPRNCQRVISSPQHHRRNPRNLRRSFSCTSFDQSKMGGEVMTAAAFRDSKRKTDRRVFVSFHLLQLLPFRATARRILFEAECLERLNFIHAQVFDADLLQWDCYGKRQVREFVV